eukprot:1755118-Lingulodinium_polyedra.AAC.1
MEPGAVAAAAAPTAPSSPGCGAPPPSSTRCNRASSEVKRSSSIRASPATVARELPNDPDATAPATRPRTPPRP